MNNMSAFQLYRTSWFSQNLSSRALNVFKVGDETTLSGTLFHNGIIMLQKLNLRISQWICDCCNANLWFLVS